MSTIKYKVLNQEGQEAGSIELDSDVFGAPIKAALVHETVRWQRAKRRAGTHSTLGRSDMKGGGKKPWRQKGTGRARAGSNVSPLWVGGAQSHGPKPRSYEFRLPKRVRLEALKSVLAAKVKSHKLIILEDLQIPEGKTKAMSGVLEAIGVGSDRAVFVCHERNEMVWRAGQNIAKLNLLLVDGMNVYDLMRNKTLISTRSGIAAIQERIRGKSSSGVANG